MKYIRYDSPVEMCDFGIDFSNEEYIPHGLTKNRKEIHFDINQITNGSILFIKWDLTHELIKILPQIQEKGINIVLITGRGDNYIDQNHVDYIMKFSCVDSWYRCNPVRLDPRIDFLPIGFSEEEREFGSQTIIENIYNKKINPDDKIDMVYVPYFSKTNNRRYSLLNSFVEKHKDRCVIEKDRLKFDDYLETLSNFKYCLVLCGNGQDVHRNYECLLTSTVPVMESSAVRDYYQQYLKVPIELYENFTGNVEFDSTHKNKITYNYWFNMIKKKSDKIKVLCLKDSP